MLDERNKFIDEWLKREVGFADLCRGFGISRKTGYKWVDRFQQGGRPELEDASRAPDVVPHAISSATAEAILNLRREHPTWGARKLEAYLKRKQADEHWPAPSTIGELLRREGLTANRRHKRKTPPYTAAPLGHAQEANQVWCADFKGWFLCGDGTRCDPLTMTDAYSRYLLRCRAVEKTNGIHVRSAMEAVFREYGMPLAIRTDNGAPFASRAPGGLSRLGMWWARLGIRHERIDPGKPQQNGRHERMHKTMKAETATPPETNQRRQQQSFQRFQREYNHERPHEAIEYCVPADLYVASTRLYPSRVPEPVYPEGAQLRRISQQGSLKWKGERTFLSELLARETVGLLEVDDDLFEVYYGAVFLGWFEESTHVFQTEKRPYRRRKKT